jgi:dTMP kinase
MRRRDQFYVFEGINGAGKSSAMEKVAEKLRVKYGPQSVVTFANPTQGPIGMELRRFIAETKTRGLPPFFSKQKATVDFASHLAMLFLADRVAMQRELLAVPNDKIILCDRYSLSTLVYQCAMIGDVHYASDLAKTIIAAHETMLKPERTIVFDLPVQVARFRRSAQGERIDDAMMAEIDPVAAAMYRDVTRFTEEYDTYSESWPFFGEARVVDANRPPAEVVDVVYELCSDSIPF